MAETDAIAPQLEDDRIPKWRPTYDPDPRVRVEPQVAQALPDGGYREHPLDFPGGPDRKLGERNGARGERLHRDACGRWVAHADLGPFNRRESQFECESFLLKTNVDFDLVYHAIGTRCHRDIKRTCSLFNFVVPPAHDVADVPDRELAIRDSPEGSGDGHLESVVRGPGSGGRARVFSGTGCIPSDDLDARLRPKPSSRPRDRSRERATVPPSIAETQPDRNHVLERSLEFAPPRRCPNRSGTTGARSTRGPRSHRTPRGRRR